MRRVPPDAAARAQITGQLDRTLFVDAGAGSGKTRSLVDRVVAVVLHPDSAVPLRHVAAVTFTEKAGAELRDRLRVAFEAALTGADPGSERASRAAGALEDLDAAAIGTLHSFAERILGEHPVEAGLPPLIEVLDEVASSVAFDERWTALRAALLDDPGLEQALLLALAAGMRLEDLRSMARAFNDNWDLLESRVLTMPVAALPPVDTAGLCAEALRLTELRGHCIDGDDKFLPRLDCLAGWAGRLQAATGDEARVAVLAEAAGPQMGPRAPGQLAGLRPGPAQDRMRRARHRGQPDAGQRSGCRAAPAGQAHRGGDRGSRSGAPRRGKARIPRPAGPGPRPAHRRRARRRRAERPAPAVPAAAAG